MLARLILVIVCTQNLHAQTSSEVINLESELLRVSFRKDADGISLISFFDRTKTRELAPNNWGSFFWLYLQVAAGETPVTSSEGWQGVSWRRVGDSKLEMNFARPEHAALGDFHAKVTITLEGNFTSWSMEVSDSREAIVRGEFPVILAGPLGGEPADDRLHYPRGSGVLYPAPYRDTFLSTRYPSGWASYQMMGLYDGDTGLYYGIHDPTGTTKDLWVQSVASAAKFSTVWPREVWQSELPGVAVMGVVHGDWYDAAQVYRAWAESEAPWFPRQHHRTALDDVMIWAVDGEDSFAALVNGTIAFQRYMNVPTALHWYNWHQIPFDNDYPNYFPPRDGFRNSIAALQAEHVLVMPYINARLWDTDLPSFVDEGFAGAAKDVHQRNYVEEYGNGQKLAPMCPTTTLWQTKVKDIVKTLVQDYRADGVYLDQMAAAPPVACYDSSHSHPQGAGHWWVSQGYGPMLEAMRQDLRNDQFLTSECNAEPFAQGLDGYLSWHFQYDGQVPIFAAIYGGRVHIFGRAHKGGPTPGAALRTRTGQAFVFGEQLGWIDPNMMSADPTSAAFIRKLAQTRYRLRKYFVGGTMLRPPAVSGDIPNVTSDWYWSGNWPVTISALQRGQWRAADGDEVLLFVNVSEEPIRFSSTFPRSATFSLEPLSVTFVEVNH